LILLSVWFNLLRRRWFMFLAFALYLVQVSYAVYEGFIRSYYLLDPIFYNDFFLFADGGSFLLHSMSLPPIQYLAGGLLLASLLALLYGLNRLLFVDIPADRLTLTTRLALIGLGVAALVSMMQVDGKVGGLETAVTSTTAKISQNIQLSQVAKAEADRFDSQNLAHYYQFTDLREKPDIYLIFLESYGSVLYKRADFFQTYVNLLEKLEDELDNSGWAVASTRSTSPTWGGGSWISYTSTLSGLRLDSHAQYLAMFNRYVREPFPHLTNYLRDQGYRSYRLSPNSDVLNDIEWQRYKSFYGVDEWLRFPDLNYNGPLFGWGPSPPDQYALNYAHAYMNQAFDTPHVFFFITQNSHYPWTPLPEVVPDWQTLNDAPPVPPPPTQRQPIEIMRQQYLASIEYELKMVTDFIVEEADKNDIFVIVGDHQPARVARYADGWDTPMHIISKNETLIESFTEYGFVPGLLTRSRDPAIHHEGFYSLFMRVLLAQYGQEPTNLPEYRPDGIPLS
jgi:phosphoglycerol transferase MdoB-like AlkP superfamily enzyme